MAQTTGAITFRAVKIESSLNGSAWTDISGFANRIEVSGGDREIGEFYTADGDTAIVGAGKRSHLEVTCTVAYTEGGSEPYSQIITAYEATSSYYLRWSPKGGTSGQFMFTTSSGIIATPVYPGGEVQSGDPVAIEFTIHVVSITKSTIA